jgi:hypothetical protein
MTSDSGAAYKLVFTEELRMQLRTWSERAVTRGILAQYAATLNTIQHQLTTDPLTWGDPSFDLNYLDLQVYQRACTPLHITYAVDVARRIVYATKLAAFPGGGLEQED